MAAASQASPGNHDLPFAKELFEAADRLRGSVESAEYKHLVLGLLFLKYISDSFDRRREALDRETRNPDSDLFTEIEAERTEILEDRDEYLAENVFWVPAEARFDRLLQAAAQPDIGERVDQALEEIERDNSEQLRGVLPRIYARSAIDYEKLGALVSTVAKIGFGDDAEKARDVLGRTYEYFIKAFARSEGHRGGEFYTPASVTRLLVEMLEPYEGRVLDPACGSGGLFIQSAEFIKRHGGRARQISILGQELNQATWRICKMNLAIHGLSGDIQLGNSLLDDKFSGKRADFVLANPPFNMKKWGAAQAADDARWSYGTPPDSNANYAWIQHFIHHLAPDGRAGFVMANGSLGSTTSNEGAIREAVVRADLVDCIVALPGQLFFTTGVPVCLWLLDRNKSREGGRDRRDKVLFINAREMGHRLTRTQIELSEDEIEQIAATFRGWRGETGAPEYGDVPGFCKSVEAAAVADNEFALAPSLYVDEAFELPEIPSGALMQLQQEIANGFGETARLDRQIVDQFSGWSVQASETTERQVADLLAEGTLQIGDGYRAKNVELGTTGLPFLRAGDIDGGFGFQGVDHLVEESIPRAGDKISRPGDVVFTSKGTVGRFAFVTAGTPEFVYSPQLCFWRVLDDEVIDPRYLFVWMRSDLFRQQLNRVKGQTDMADYVSLRDQRRMTLTLPPLEEQRRIGEVVAALQERIDLSRRLSRTLEEGAMDLFRSWLNGARRR